MAVSYTHLGAATLTSLDVIYGGGAGGPAGTIWLDQFTTSNENVSDTIAPTVRLSVSGTQLTAAVSDNVDRTIPQANVIPVSYTHLDVYKRQARRDVQGLGGLRQGEALEVAQYHHRPQLTGQACDGLPQGERVEGLRRGLGQLGHRQLPLPAAQLGVAGVDAVSYTHLLTLRCVEECAGQMEETLPAGLRREHALAAAEFACRNIHFPRDEEALELARRRLIFEELFCLALSLIHICGRSAPPARRSSHSHICPRRRAGRVPEGLSLIHIS